MSKQRRRKLSENELSEYPIIYSYIYEREAQDIKRLSENFKSFKGKSGVPETGKRAITSYRIEEGKVVPVYDDEIKPSTIKTRKKK